MYVCVCAGVTDKQIQDAVAAGHQSIKALRDHLGIAASCGMCVKETRQIMDDTLRLQAAALLATELLPAQKQAA